MVMSRGLGDVYKRQMDVTRERISRILGLRELLLSFQTAFSLVDAAVVLSLIHI